MTYPPGIGSKEQYAEQGRRRLFGTNLYVFDRVIRDLIIGPFIPFLHIPDFLLALTMSFNFPSLKQFKHIRRTVDEWRRWEVELQGLPPQHQELLRQTLMVVRADNRANPN